MSVQAVSESAGSRGGGSLDRSRRQRAALLFLLPVLCGLLSPAFAEGQYLDPDLPPELFELEQLYILPRGVFHGYVTGAASPLVGGGATQGPVVVGGKLGLQRAFQLELDLRDRLGADVPEARDPLDPFTELAPDTADDARMRAGLRAALPAAPLDVISASGALIASLRGEETVLLELTLGAAHRIGVEGPVLAAQVLHRRGMGSDEGPEGGDIEATSFGGMALVRGGPLLWSLEGRYQLNAGEQESVGRVTPGVYWSGPLTLGLGVPVVLRDGAEAGLSATVGITLGDDPR